VNAGGPGIAARLRYLVLGPLEARDAFGVLPVRRDRHLELLAVLVAARPEPVSAADLVDALWGAAEIWPPEPWMSACRPDPVVVTSTTVGPVVGRGFGAVAAPAGRAATESPSRVMAVMAAMVVRAATSGATREGRRRCTGGFPRVLGPAFLS
jgi:hypothetical protein